MIEKTLEEIRAFYRKYYDHLPAEGQDDIRAELNAEEHGPETINLLLYLTYRWEKRYLERQEIKKALKQGRK